MDSPSSNLFPTNNDSPAREKLLTLRLALLRLHKTLINMERREYEREHGHVNTGELFQLVIDHAQFAWLHNISEFIDAHDEFGDVMEPGELCVVDDQLEKIAGVHMGVLALVFAALHVDKSFVEA